MKKKIYLLVLLLLCIGIGCSNSVPKDSIQDKIIANEQSEQKNDEITEEKTKEDDKEEKKSSNAKQDDESISLIEQQPSSQEKVSSNNSNVMETNEQVKTEEQELVIPPSTTAVPPKQETIEPPKEEVSQPIKQDSMANSVMSQINSYRIHNRLQPLNSSQYYQDKANAHALDMANKRALWHSDNGECITNHPDPFNAWINSPEHREIILTENNTIGVVSIYYVDGYYYSVFSTAW